jgi:hypothetical protein
MPGFSQIDHPRSSAAVSAPSNRNVEGYDRPVTGLWRMTPAGQGIPWRAQRSGDQEEARA